MTEAEAHQSWPAKKGTDKLTNKQRKTEKEREKSAEESVSVG